MLLVKAISLQEFSQFSHDVKCIIVVPLKSFSEF